MGFISLNKDKGREKINIEREEIDEICYAHVLLKNDVVGTDYPKTETKGGVSL